MNVRVFLLLAITALFGAIWSSDDRYQSQRPFVARAGEITPVIVEQNSSARPTPVLAIPEDIPAGDYLVVLANGQSLRLRLPGRSVNAATGETPRTFYSSAAEGQRAFFIRANEDVEFSATERGPRAGISAWMTGAQAWSHRTIDAGKHDLRRHQWAGRRALLLTQRRAAALWNGGASITEISSTLLAGRFSRVQPSIRNAAGTRAPQLR